MSNGHAYRSTEVTFLFSVRWIRNLSGIPRLGVEIDVWRALSQTTPCAFLLFAVTKSDVKSPLGVLLANLRRAGSPSRAGCYVFFGVRGSRKEGRSYSI